MIDTVSAFQLGSSVVVTLPKELGIKPGQKLKINKRGKKITLEEKKLSDKEIQKLIKSLSGGLRLKDDLTPEEINKELDRRYEEMLP